MSASLLRRSLGPYHLTATLPRASPSHDDVIYFTETNVILEKSCGPFSDKHAAYFGPARMRISDPSSYDAAVALADGRIDDDDDAGTEPPKDTPLGGGIGVHGWAGAWPGTDRQNLTWGCISVQNPDLERLVEATPVGTVVMILP